MLMHLCPGLNSATKFTKLTIFRDDLEKTAKFAKITIFHDDLIKTTKFIKLTTFDELPKSGAADFKGNCKSLLRFSQLVPLCYVNNNTSSKRCYGYYNFNGNCKNFRFTFCRDFVTTVLLFRRKKTLYERRCTYAFFNKRNTPCKF